MIRLRSGGLDPLDLGLNEVRQRTIIACDLLKVVQGYALGQIPCGDDLRVVRIHAHPLLAAPGEGCKPGPRHSIARERPHVVLLRFLEKSKQKTEATPWHAKISGLPWPTSGPPRRPTQGPTRTAASANARPSMHSRARPGSRSSTPTMTRR